MVVRQLSPRLILSQSRGCYTVAVFFFLDVCNLHSFEALLFLMLAFCFWFRYIYIKFLRYKWLIFGEKLFKSIEDFLAKTNR